MYLVLIPEGLGDGPLKLARLTRVELDPLCFHKNNILFLSSGLCIRLWDMGQDKSKLFPRMRSLGVRPAEAPQCTDQVSFSPE